VHRPIAVGGAMCGKREIVIRAPLSAAEGDLAMVVEVAVTLAGMRELWIGRGRGGAVPGHETRVRL
jgi:hypothetical protein